MATNEVNVNGTIAVLVAAKECGVKKVVYASSSSVYGDTPTLPKAEGMLPNPKSPYAVSKLAGEYYCRVFSDAYGISTVALRYFNVFGPRQDPESQYAAVIPRFITRTLAGKPPIIYGDGTQTRDFTYVKDVVQANVKAMESNAQGVFNVAYNQRISLLSLVDIIAEETGVKVNPVFEPPRPGDIHDSQADILQRRRRLGIHRNIRYDQDSRRRLHGTGEQPRCRDDSRISVLASSILSPYHTTLAIRIMTDITIIVPQDIVQALRLPPDSLQTKLRTRAWLLRCMAGASSLLGTQLHSQA